MRPAFVIPVSVACLAVPLAVQRDWTFAAAEAADPIGEPKGIKNGPDEHPTSQLSATGEHEAAAGRRQLLLLSRSLGQLQNAWLIRYCLRYNGSQPLIVRRADVRVSYRGWLSNSRCPQHVMPVFCAGTVPLGYQSLVPVPLRRPAEGACCERITLQLQTPTSRRQRILLAGGRDAQANDELSTTAFANRHAGEGDRNEPARRQQAGYCRFGRADGRIPSGSSRATGWAWRLPCGTSTRPPAAMNRFSAPVCWPFTSAHSQLTTASI